jgi:hypothetical protein
VSNNDTTTADTIPPGADKHVKLNGSPIHQIKRLKDYLEIAFPDEMTRSNKQVEEHPADTAIRLLTGLTAKAHPSSVLRCDQMYCNKPKNHLDEHGWINY